MTTKQTANSANSRVAAAAHILYRMANSANNGGYNTEPITPVSPGVIAMLQPGTHFTIPNNVVQSSVSGGVQYSQPSYTYTTNTSSGGATTSYIPLIVGSNLAIKQEPGQQQLVFQQPFQNFIQTSQGGGTTQYLLATRGNEGNQLQQGVLRMANGQGMMGDGSPGPGSLTGSTGNKGRSGGRKPRDDKLTPEEDERRKVRRERNKQAAARCRKRRMDHTNVLVEETEGLEAVQANIKAQIDELQREKDEILYILQEHRPVCSKELVLPTASPPEPHPDDVPMEDDTAPAVPDDSHTMPPPPVVQAPVPPVTVVVIPTVVVEGVKPGKKNGGATRPGSLPVKSTMPGDMGNLTLPTPSPSKLVFNFEHSGLTPTGLTPTGLTPLIPSCSTEAGQNKSPPRPAETPTETTSPNLVSL